MVISNRGSYQMSRYMIWVGGVFTLISSYKCSMTNFFLPTLPCHRCSNCGATAHRTWQCPEKQNVTSNVLCTLCGGAGHIAQDCRNKGPGQRAPSASPSNTVDKAKMDSEVTQISSNCCSVVTPKIYKENFHSHIENLLKDCLVCSIDNDFLSAHFAVSK